MNIKGLAYSKKLKRLRRGATRTRPGFIPTTVHPLRVSRAKVTEMEREPSPKSCAEYATRTVTGEYKYPEWQLNFICKQSAKHRPSWGPISDEKEKRGIMLKASHLCACLELERRDRYARGVGKKPKVAKKVRRSGVQVYRESLSAEYKRLRSMPKSKLAELAKEYSDERKAHPKLTNAVILQIAKDHLAYKARPRKRWKRRSAT